MKEGKVLILMFTLVVFSLGATFVKVSAQSTKTITYWYFGPEHEAVMTNLKLVERFEKENPSIKVNAENYPWGGRRGKIYMAYAAGTAPDVLFTNLDFVPKIADIGGLQNLEPYLKKNPEVRDRFSEKLLKTITYKGKLYLMPFDLETAGMWYNKDLLEAAGISTRTKDLYFDWKDFIRITQKLTRDLNSDGKIDQWGYDYPYTMESVTFGYYSFLYQAGGDVFNKDHTYIAFNEAPGVEALQFICDLWNKYKVIPPASKAGTPELFESKRVAISGPLGSCYTNWERKQYPELNFVVGPPLKHKERVGFGDVESLSMYAYSKCKEAAWEWISFLTRGDNIKAYDEFVGFGCPNKLVKLDYGDEVLNQYLPEWSEYTHPAEIDEVYRDLNMVMVPAVRASIDQEKTPQEALDDAAKEANEWLAPRRK